jgi:hypothetical protein
MTEHAWKLDFNCWGNKVEHVIAQELLFKNAPKTHLIDRNTIKNNIYNRIKNISKSDDKNENSCEIDFSEPNIIYKSCPQVQDLLDARKDVDEKIKASFNNNTPIPKSNQFFEDSILKRLNSDWTKISKEPFPDVNKGFDYNNSAVSFNSLKEKLTKLKTRLAELKSELNKNNKYIQIHSNLYQDIKTYLQNEMVSNQLMDNIDNKISSEYLMNTVKEIKEIMMEIRYLSYFIRQINECYDEIDSINSIIDIEPLLYPKNNQQIGCSVFGTVSQ